jgi:DNA-binding SARP family transcriptional activator
MEFRILGPLEVADGDRLAPLASAKERALLALLLLEPNRVVPAERLIDQLWDGRPPESAATSLRVLVSRLRKTLARLDDAELIVTRAPGYVLTASPGDIDASRFDALVTRGRSLLTAGDAEAAAGLLRQALELWRGPALSDVADLAAARAEAVRLEESRLTVLEDRVEADLGAGRHGPLCAELESLTRAHPLRERLWSQRMVALYRAGRQADALRAYQDLRTILGDELGIEPSPEVTRLDAAIVRQDPTIDWRRATAALVRADEGDLPTGVVTLLLTDIAGSTPLWESSPSAMADALIVHDDLIRNAVTAAGGRVLKARGEGDGTFSVFARATDAADAALDAQRAIAATDWPGALTLPVRMAIHTGETVERDGDYFGTEVNRAARLRSVADGGQIVVSASTAQVIVDHLHNAELVELGEQALRGLSRPEEVFELRPIGVGDDVAFEPAPPTEAPSLPEPLARGVAGVFVGREADLERLDAIWSDVVANESHLVLLAGEAGIGKSRLAAEFARRVFDADATVLFGRCDEDGGEPYQPFAEAIRDYASGSGRGALQNSPHLGRLIPDVAQQLGFAPAPSLGDADAERRALFDAVASLLSSAPTPVLLVLDDLHWAARPTLLMLRHLMRTRGEVPVMVVATYRDTDVDRAHPLSGSLADLRRDVALTRMGLVGLDVAGVVAYVEATAGQTLEAAERELADAVHEHTEGNPFFVVEMMRHLVETGAVWREDGRWHTDMTSIDQAGLPEGVRDVIGRRLARLSEIANRALGIAAVIGPEFALQVLERVDERDSTEQLLDALEDCLRSGLIRESAPGRYAFTHALIRQTLYDEMMSTRRARMHRQVGEAIESLPDHDKQVEALAHHFAEAALDGQVGKAVAYALASGRRARDRLAHEEAIKHYERGIALLELDDVMDRTQRAELLHELAIARWSSGDRPGAQEAAVAAAADAAEIGDATRLAGVAALVAGLSELGIEDAATEKICEQALRALADDELASRARVMSALSRYRAVALGRGVEASALAAEALELARRAGQPQVTISAINAQILAWQGLGKPHDQLALAHELVALADSSDNDRARAEGVVARAQANLELGETRSVADDVVELRALSRTYRWWLPAAFAALFGWALEAMAGRFSEAQALEEEAAGLARGSLDVTIAAIGAAGARMVLQGRIDEGVRYVKPLLGLSPGVMDAMSAAMDAYEHALHGDFDAATVELRGLLAGDEIYYGLDSLRPVMLMLLTETVARTRDTTSADTIAAAFADYPSQFLPVGRGGALYGTADRCRGILATMRQRWDEAEGFFAAALELETRAAAPTFAAATQYWLAQMLVERGRPEDRARAEALLTESLAAARSLGLALVEHDAEALLASM